MKKIVITLLFSLISLWGCSQIPLMLTGDTASSVLVQAPDTIKSFSVDVGGVGEPFSSLKTEIRSYWTLEEAAGNAVDSVGIVTDLPVTGGVTRQQAGAIDNCYSFATNGYLGGTSGSYLEFDGSFSVQAWINTTSTGAWDCIMADYQATNYGWELITVGDPVRNVWWRMRWSGGNTTIESTTDINDGAWHHIVASYSAADDTMKLWVNGNLEDSEKNINGTWYSSDTRLTIADRYNSNAYFNGKIDEPATWNKELTETEVDSLFAKSQYPFGTEGSGGDSLRMRNIDFDERADTFRVNYKIGAWPATRISDSVVFAFGLVDTADYNDTTFRYYGEKDTTACFTEWSGITATDIWTVVPNKYTAFVDSSDVAPPDQDVGIWDIIYWNDFEDLSAPSYYDRTTFLSEWSPVLRYASRNEYRASDYRSPQWFNDNLKDSIVIDETTGSKVMQVLWSDTIMPPPGREDGQSGRGGDYWLSTIAGEPYTEIYVSSNIMLRPGFDWSAGGKLCWGIGGGSGGGTGITQPGYGDGFRNIVIFGWDDRYPTYDTKGVPGFYNYYQDMPGTYGEWHAFGDFQPVGEGLQYNSFGNFTFDVTDSTWVNITVRCVTNTHSGSTPVKNGIFEGYINGHLVAQWGGLYLITYPDIGNEINLIHWYQAFGGGGPPLRDEWIWNDDICIFTYDVSVDVPRGNELSQPGRVLSLPNWPKPLPPE